MKRNRLLTVVILCLTLPPLVAMRTGEAVAPMLQTYSEAWIETLDPDQQQKALLAFDGAERIDWNFIPLPTRKGLPLMDMNDAQRTAALRTVRAALSEVGYDKATKIMLLENVLRQMEGPGSEERRNPEKYYLTIYGTPTDSGSWGLSFEGHHLSLNFVCRDGQVVASTPQFVAANPAQIKSEVEGTLGKGTEVLRLEEEIAFDLINGLSDELRQLAIIAPESPAEIRFVGQPHVTPTEPEGLLMSDMDETAQARLRRLIEVYANTLPQSIASARLAKIEQEGPESIHFAWAGATKRHVGHYYRVQGESFLIELVNTQPDAEGTPANHIHAVWRDPTGDFALPTN